MDMAGADPNIEPQKDNEDSVNYHPPSMSDWHVNDTNLTNRSVRTITTGNSMGQSSPCSSAAMVDSFCFPTWDQPSNGQSLGYSEALGGMNWNPNAILRGSMFLPNVLPPSLPQFPADLGFIERAARFSCFSGGNLVEMMNSFSSRASGPIQGPNRPFGDNDLRPLPGIAEVPNEGLIPTEHGTEGSPFKNDKISESFTRTHDEKKNGGDVSGNKPDEAEFTVQEESSGKGLGSKKRKKTEQESRNIEIDETPKQSDETANDAAEIKQKGDQNLTSTSKPSGKNGKQATQGSDPPKEEYIHVRARRGQATNSHSLAERVRREKISERMKFLQDLVPGCSKVTGKAVMLDEIINYVQSLQRQVEFLSMKLATVNPRLEFNIEGFLKDIPQPRPGLSSSLAFPPDMTAPFLSVHPSQHGGPGLIQAGLTGMGISSEMFQRPVSTLLSGGSKESCSQVPSAWEDELRNIVHMGFNSSTPPNSQDLSGSVPSGHMKAEP